MLIFDFLYLGREIWIDTNQVFIAGGVGGGGVVLIVAICLGLWKLRRRLKRSPVSVNVRNHMTREY